MTTRHSYSSICGETQWCITMANIQVSEKHRVVGVPVTPSLRGAFPQAKVVRLADTDLILLPHAVPETIALRGLGVEVPAPILTQYHWPAPRHQPPFRVQKLTAALLIS